MTGTLERNPTSRPTKPIGTYRPLPWQIAPWRDTGLILLLTGSAGGGKSKIAAEKLHGFNLKYPGAMTAALRKTRESMVNSTVLVLEKTIADDPRVRHNQHKSRFEYSNGSILVYGGMKDRQQREQIRSIGQDGGLDLCWMEEANAFTEDDFNEVLARMRGRAADWRQLLLTTNPDAPSHWIFKRLIQGKEAAVYFSGAKDNPHNPADYLQTLQRMTGVQKERLAAGLWVQAEGVVYPEYSPTIHEKHFDIPADWRRIRVVDFGHTNPFVCQWWAIDPDGRMYRYREIYYTQRLVEDHARDIVRRSAGERISATVADHDAEDRATLHRHGVPTIPAYKAVERGIQAVAARLIPAGDGRPRIYFLPDALTEVDTSLESRHLPICTEQEFPAYVWPKRQDGKALKEEPVKENDHGLDATRYAVAYVDNLAGSRVRIAGAPVRITG